VTSRIKSSPTLWAAWASIALALLGSNVRAASDDQIVDLFESPAIREHIGIYVVLRNIVLENTRRAMMLERCDGLDRRFPRSSTPAMDAVLKKSEDWALRGDTSLVKARFGMEQETRALMSVAARDGLSGADLAAWKTFRSSDDGQRAAAVEAMVAGIQVVGQTGLSDLMSGAPWAWPLERLRRLADAVGRRQQFDTALERTQAGSAAAVAELNGALTQPIAAPVDLAALAGSMERGELLDQFFAALSAEDRSAYAKLRAHPIATKWAKAKQAMATVIGEAAGAKQFCQRSGLTRCGPGSPIDRQVQALRDRFEEVGREMYGLNPMRELVKKMPEAACRAR